MKKPKGSENPDNPEKSKTGSLKSIIGENNKLTKAISVMSLFVIMFGLFAFIIVGLYRFDLIDFPEFIQNLFFKTDSDEFENEKDDSNIYKFLHDNDEKDDDDFNGGYTLEITKDIIANTNLPDNLYIETEANYYDINGNITRTEEMSLWKKGGKYKYILTVNSRPEESYINDTKNELIENFVTGSRLTRPAVGEFSFDNIPHIQNINYYLNLLESGEITSYSLRQNSNSNIIRIKYSVPELDQRELIDISLDTGIVLYVECTAGKNNDWFYKCVTTVNEAYYDGDGQAEAKTSIKDSLFEIKQ